PDDIWPSTALHPAFKAQRPRSKGEKRKQRLRNRETFPSRNCRRDYRKFRKSPLQVQ
ncbi:uncharacterized, partial [Tachysurus ichikawai]